MPRVRQRGIFDHYSPRRTALQRFSSGFFSRKKHIVPSLRFAALKRLPEAHIL